MIKLRFLGHAMFLLAFPGCRVLIDPFFGDAPKETALERRVPCAVKPRDLKKVDVVLATHEHFDHFEKESIEFFAREHGAMVGAHYDLLARLDIHERQKVPLEEKKPFCFKGVRVTPLPAHHPNAFCPYGFNLEYGGVRVFHAGDTDLNRTLLEHKADILLVPIGGKLTMDIVDAVRVVKTMKPRIVIPMHYDTFDFIAASPHEFKNRIDKSVLKTECVVLEPGQAYTYKARALAAK